VRRKVLYGFDAPRVQNFSAEGIERGEQRVEDGVGVIRGGKEFAGVFLLQCDTEFLKEGGGGFTIKTAEDFLDRVA
jgi:hypothetical protein